MRKELISGSIGLVIGLLVGFLIFQKIPWGSKDLISVNPESDYLDFTPQKDSSKGGQRISNDSAIIMVNEFKKESEKIWYPLKTADGQNLKGFFVRWQIFDTLIRQNGCNGIRFYLAKHVGTAKRHGYTLVIVGTKPGLNDPYKDLNSNIDDAAGGYYEEIDPCPNNCGSTVTNPMLMNKRFK